MVKITETALRDAHQSLIATRMRTEDMLDIVEKLDDVGYYSLEIWGGATFDSCIRYLNEDPWHRLRDIKSRMKKTPAQMLLRAQNLVGYRHYPDDIVEKFVTKSFEYGIDIFRIFDAVNDLRNVKTSVVTAKKLGAHVQGTLSYTTSPVHTPETYINLAKEFAEMDCDSICIKDMAGLLTPAAVTEIVKGIKKEVSVPVDVHSHCTSGIAPYTYFAALEAGADIIDTAISPFSFGTSQPSTESTVAALKNTPYDTGIDLDSFREITKYFKDLREKYSSLYNPISVTVNTDILNYQVPGGMLSNLVSQLKEQNALDRFEDVLKEMPKVREEMGYPPLVTPASQIIVAQSVLNVITGERYKIISKEIKDYVRGHYGKPPSPIKAEIISKIINDEKPITVRPADLLEPEFELRKKEAESLGIANSEEDILTYAIYPSIAPKFLKGEVKAEELPTVRRTGNIISVSDSAPTNFEVHANNETYTVVIHPKGMSVEPRNQSSQSSGSNSSNKVTAKDMPGAVLSSMQGMVISINVSVGQTVNKGDQICLIEAFKMGNTLTAPWSGEVKQIMINKGDSVSVDDVLMVIE